MKHVYPVRHPAALDKQAKDSTTASTNPSHEPSLPRERAGSAGTDEGAGIQQGHDRQIAPDRGRGQARG